MDYSKLGKFRRSRLSGQKRFIELFFYSKNKTLYSLQHGISLNAVLPRQEHKRRHSKQFCTDVLKYGVVKIFNGLQHIF